MKIADERNFRAVDGDAGDVHLLGKNKRNEFHADPYGFGSEERLLAELRIIGDGEIVGGDRAGEERETQIADVDLAAQCGGSFFFNGRSELIHGNQKRSHDDEYHEYGNDDEDDAKSTAHVKKTSGAAGGGNDAASR